MKTLEEFLLKIDLLIKLVNILITIFQTQIYIKLFIIEVKWKTHKN